MFGHQTKQAAAASAATLAAYGEQGDVAEALGREAERYLAAVATYRQLGCEPSWRKEEAAHVSA